MDAVNNPADDFDNLVALMAGDNEAANAVRVLLPELWPDQHHATNRVDFRVQKYICLLLCYVGRLDRFHGSRDDIWHALSQS